MDTKGGQPLGGGRGGVNWVIGIDMYTLMCIKLMSNKKKNNNNRKVITLAQKLDVIQHKICSVI